MELTLRSKLTDLSGIGAKVASKFEELEVFNIKDLLTYFPRKYLDTSNMSEIIDLHSGSEEEKYTILAEVESFRNIFTRRKGFTMQMLKLVDPTGKLNATFFNQTFLERVFKRGKKYYLNGKVKFKGNIPTFYPGSYEEFKEEEDSLHLNRISPEYIAIKGLSKKILRKYIKNALDNLDNIEIPDEMELIEASKQMDLKTSLREIHFPSNDKLLQKAIDTLSLRELVNIHFAIDKTKGKKIKAFKVEDKNRIIQGLNKWIKSLPFEPSKDQLSVIEQVLDKIANSENINALLQGDVGSGKTLVAIATALITHLAGFQTVLLAPTSILAQQHFDSFKNFLGDFDVKISLQTGKNKKREQGDIIIGTTAILFRQEDLLDKVGLLIADEQHKFGVEQREEILNMYYKKNKFRPHFMHMSATPIPRSVSEIFWKGSEVYTLKSTPFGKKDIKTKLVPDEKREDMYNWVEESVKSGAKVFWVCPVVDEDLESDLTSVKAKFEEIKEKFQGYKVVMLHGKMKVSEKDEVMSEFAQNDSGTIMVASSVVEVGIDVRDANIMVIESAERFGLSQLHQLRGRVGRNGQEAWCFLFHSKNVSDYSIERLKYFSEELDGFKISEYDFEHRGPGEILGVQQSGIPKLKVAYINDIKMIERSEKVFKELKTKGVKKIELFS